jgi:hypothetical protein
MGAFELVVSVAGDRQRAKRVNPAAEEPEDVERRLIGPVHVLEHEQGRATSQLVGENRRDLVWPGATPDELVKLAASFVRDLEQRSERARCQEPVARAPEDAGGRTALVGELPEKSRLPGPRLTTQKDEAAATGQGAVKQLVELGKLIGTLEQLARLVHNGRSLTRDR